MSRFAAVCCRYLVLTAGLAMVVPATGHAQAPPADARFVYEFFRPGGVAPLSGTYSVSQSTPFTLQVYLRQSAGSTDVLASGNGLQAGGVQVSYGNPTGTPGVVRVGSVNDIQYNPAFDDTGFSDPSRVATPDYARFAAVVSLQNVTGVPPVNGRVYLGAFTFQVDGSVGSHTLLRAADDPNLIDTVTFTNGVILDSAIQSADLTVLVAPVPEPSGLLLTAVGVVALAFGRPCCSRSKADPSSRSLESL